MEPLGKVMLVLGLGIAGLGGFLWLAGRLFPDVRLGRLPGDINLERPGVSFSFPVTTMVLVSLVLTIVLWILGALRR